MIKLHRVEEIDSTNLEARRLWRTGLDSSTPVAVMASLQTGGIGRNGRQWSSPKGGLWISLLNPAKRPLNYYESLPLMVGLVVCQLLENITSLDFQVKWPNDVFCKGSKIAGILCQAEISPNNGAIIIGLGLNCNIGPDQIPAPLRHPACSLRQLTGQDFELESLATEYLSCLEEALLQFENTQLRHFHSQLDTRLLWKGQLVKTVEPATSRSIEGRLVGLGENGQLILEVDGQRKLFSSGELESICRHQSASL